MIKKLLISIILTVPFLVSAQTALYSGGTGLGTSTAGDLLVGTSSTLRYSRLPIGLAGTVLQASSTAPFKMTWVATSSLGILGGGITNLYASTTFPSFTYATATYYLNTNPSNFISLGSLSGTYPIIYNSGTGNISSAFSTSTINNFTNLNTFVNASTTNLSALGATITNLATIGTTTLATLGGNVGIGTVSPGTL